MNLPIELKSRLSAYLQGNSGLDEFREWFADVLRTANQHEKTTRSLVWSLGYALARFGNRHITLPQLREELDRIVQRCDEFVGKGSAPLVQTVDSPSHQDHSNGHTLVKSEPVSANAIQGTAMLVLRSTALSYAILGFQGSGEDFSDTLTKGIVSFPATPAPPLPSSDSRSSWLGENWSSLSSSSGTVNLLDLVIAGAS